MNGDVLNENTVLLNARAEDKEEAIRMAGGLLVDQGYADATYIDKMMEREASHTTYIGNSVAIPHGTEEGKEHIHRSGISIVQLPEGVDFGDGQIAKIVIGIAGKGDEHMDMLSKIALVVSEEENVTQMVKAASKEELLAMFQGVN
ncbi:MAG: PTS sugar transporter subunit IIA [Firmicutes bacterium]|uniref:Mannitol-specific phosphotransferase enzyme IIA component n=1 Tax=Melghirimyces thermohalophilus TaxID=1236220 RepID=A0A1G6NL24_9BACL|nr:PTS sugar transporter subunit IIA [Melghirimyces thermohalophilus]MDA8352285.1 PTS sugar transporter subunit IIA [Bacillota bacterium]SDC68351.1 PTS system, mannitol-specific IIA component [Melghirimyces thermohalophilus]